MAATGRILKEEEEEESLDSSAAVDTTRPTRMAVAVTWIDEWKRRSAQWIIGGRRDTTIIFIVNSNWCSGNTDRGVRIRRRWNQCISGDIHRWQLHEIPKRRMQQLIISSSSSSSSSSTTTKMIWMVAIGGRYSINNNSHTICITDTVMETYINIVYTNMI